MSTRMKTAALAALSVAQLAAATWSIARYESTLASGTLYRIRTLGVDPADAFRGRYVAVQPAITISKPIAREVEELLGRIQGSEEGYVLLTTGVDGYAQAAQILTEPPAQGDYLKFARVWPQWNPATRPEGEATSAGYNIIFSFDRYYMNEAAAPAAQNRLAAAAGRNAPSQASLTVRVKDGIGVIEGLFIDGVPIEELVRAPPKP